MTTDIPGISALCHDSAAALVCGGEIVAAAGEERFSRKKGDAGHQAHAVDSLPARGGHHGEGLGVC